MKEGYKKKSLLNGQSEEKKREKMTTIFANDYYNWHLNQTGVDVEHVCSLDVTRERQGLPTLIQDEILINRKQSHSKRKYKQFYCVFSI